MDGNFVSWSNSLYEIKTLIPGPPLFDTLKKYHINYFNIPAGALELLPKQDLPTLKAMMAIGDVCSKKTMSYWLSLCKLYNGYGPTECTIGCIMHLMTSDSSHCEIGQPLPNIEAYILDKLLLPVPIGVIGELYIGGDCLARGYLNDPKLTSERFIPNPFSSAENQLSCRIYKTGDLVRLNSKGNIEFIGREDNQYKIRGFRIEINEIIGALNRHVNVEKAFVKIFEKEANNKFIAAYIVLNNPQMTTEEKETTIIEIKQILKKVLPSFMVPSYIQVLDKIPLTKNGKVEYDKFPNPLDVQKPTAQVNSLVDSLEVGIAESFQSLLHCGSVNSNDNFFELGGHSLLASQLLYNLNEKLKVNLQLKDLFEYPTVKELASFIKQITPLQDNIPKIKHFSDAIFELTNAQKRLWFLEVLLEQKGFYNVPLSFEIEGMLDLKRFKFAINRIVDRHENLRSRFVIVEGVPKQEIIHSSQFSIDIKTSQISRRMFPRYYKSFLQSLLNLKKNLSYVAFI